MRRVMTAAFMNVFACATLSYAAGVSDTARQTIPHSASVVYRGRVALPLEGEWRVRSTADKSVVQTYLIPPDDIARHKLGRRAGAQIRQERIRAGRRTVSWLYYVCAEYAKQHQGVGPATVNDLDQEKYKSVVEILHRSPWPDLQMQNDELPGPFVFLVPEVKFRFRDEGVSKENREVLAVELHPYIDDGQHWVAYTDMSTERVPIDQGLVKKHKLAIRPYLTKPDEAEKAGRTTLLYTIVAVRRGNSLDPFRIELENLSSGQSQTITWDPAGAKRDKGVLLTLRAARRYAWQPYLDTGPAPVLRTWLASAVTSGDDANRSSRDRLNMFSLLGGRAAVEETLQRQNLVITDEQQAATIDVATIKGVTIKAHPYANMLGDKPGGKLALANVIPPDRFFVYVAKPQAILPFLDQGSDFAAAVGAGLMGNRLDYDLANRYLQWMGMPRQTMEAVLRSGVIRDLAVIAPDLFFIDGTDLTVAIRLTRPEFLSGVLRLLGVRGLTDTAVLELKSTAGTPSYWALRGDILCISSHRGEINRVLKLIENKGEGSLGRSAEFRYMLTQLPVEEETRMFAYFSDPFVRRLVGPRVKLAQRRRMIARAEMEAVTAQMLLAQLDGVGQVESVEELVKMKYLPEEFPVESYVIDSDGFVRSRTYGKLTRLKTLQEAPVERVTPAEAKSYQRYVDNYSRFWRQFFDPIAIRLNDTPDGGLDLTTFILPLIDSSIYDGLRDVLVRHEDELSLVIPQVEPTPILQFSMNVNDQQWQKIAGGFGEMFHRFGGASPALLDDLGQGVHFAVFDADPVITLGSGDVMGAFGGNVLRQGGSEMLMLPAALSMLTRRCTLMVETREPERTTRYLREAASRKRQNVNWGEVSFYQVGDQDSWVWTFAFQGVIKLRFGVEVADRYLIIRNIPWSTQDRVVDVKKAPLNGAGITVWPAACQLQLPGLFASAADQERRDSASGLGRLFPLIVSGTDVASAGQRHQQLFGFRPLHPAGGKWVRRDGQLMSSVYGSAARQRQPAYDPRKPFGLMQTIERMELTMQFEDTGLRSNIKWKLRGN